MNSLKAFYPFNGDANDSSGNSFNGIVHGAVLTEGRKSTDSGAYLFDGYSDYIELPPSVAINTDNSFSIEAWINNISITADARYVDNAIFGQTDGIMGSDYPAIVFQIMQDNKLKGAIRGISNPPLDGISESSIQNNVWNHVVLVRNAQTDNLKIYVNGDLESDETLALDGNTTSNDFASIGAYSDDLDGIYHFFYGKIDLVRIWKVALSQEEINALKNDNFIIE